MPEADVTFSLSESNLSELKKMAAILKTPDLALVGEKGGNTILLDAYNANPSSMQVAIRNFAKMPQLQKVLILGDMFEMGPTADQEHDELLQWAVTFGFTQIYTLVQHFASISAHSGLTTPSTMEELGAQVQHANYTHTAFLVKGSRGMKMEGVLNYL